MGGIKDPDELGPGAREFYDAVAEKLDEKLDKVVTERLIFGSRQNDWQQAQGTTGPTPHLSPAAVRGQQIHDVIMDEAVSGEAMKDIFGNPIGEDMQSLPTDGKLIPYSGADRLMLDGMTAAHRRRGGEVDFLQGVDGRQMKRVIRVIDPDLPEALREQEYRLPPGHTWRDGLVTLGLLRGTPKEVQALQVAEVVVARFELVPLHLPAVIHCYATVLNVQTALSGAPPRTATLRVTADGVNVPGKAVVDVQQVAVEAGSHGVFALERGIHDPGVFEVTVEPSGMRVEDGRVEIFGADRVKHVLGPGGLRGSTQYVGMPPQLSP